MFVNTYENIVILNSSLSEEEIKSAKERIVGLIPQNGGRVLKADDWGMRKLAYEIDKHKKGFYVRFVFSSPPLFIKTLEGFYKVFDPVIKYMVIKLGKKETKALEDEMRKSEEAAAAQQAAAAAAAAAAETENV